MDFAVTPSTDSSGATVLVDPSVVMTALSSSGTAIGMRHHTQTGPCTIGSIRSSSYQYTQGWAYSSDGVHEHRRVCDDGPHCGTNTSARAHRLVSERAVFPVRYPLYMGSAQV